MEIIGGFMIGVFVLGVVCFTCVVWGVEDALIMWIGAVFVAVWFIVGMNLLTTGSIL